MPLNQIGFGPRTTAFAGIPISLASGGIFNLPSGQWTVNAGPYTFLQQYDPVTQVWLPVGTGAGNEHATVSSDGYNFRLANLTGCPVGAYITNGGSGYTNGIYPAAAQLGTAAAPSVTMSAGGARPTIVVGGAINTTVTITAGGTGYTLPPILTLSAPPSGGVQATAVCTVSSGAINAVTVTNQGAGYTTAPTVTVTRHPFDTTGSGGVLTVNPTLANSGNITALTFPDHGTGGLSAVPTFTFAPASTSAATAVMCFTVTTINQQASLAGLVNANIGFAIGQSPSGAQTNTPSNPRISSGLFLPRMAMTGMSSATGGTLTPIIDGGLHMTIPIGVVYAGVAAITATGTATVPTVGGITDTSFITPV
jgi:hypothetical protein